MEVCIFISRGSLEMRFKTKLLTPRGDKGNCHHPDNVVSVIETSTYQALKKTEFYNEFFHGCEVIEVLKSNRLKFIKTKNGQRFVDVGTPFVAYAEKTNLPARETSIQSQNAFSKVLSSVGNVGAKEAAGFQNINKSYLICLHFGSEEGTTDVEEGRFYTLAVKKAQRM